MIWLSETTTRLAVRGFATEINRLIEFFRYRPNNFEHANSYQLWRKTHGEMGWDGYHRPLCWVDAQRAEILRGRKCELLAVAAKYKIHVDQQKSKFLEPPFTGLILADVAEDILGEDFPLDDQQRQAVVQWLNFGMGIAHYSVNAGKTRTFAGAAARIKQTYPEARFLYFTPAERLVRQSFAEMQRMLPGWSISQFGGGKHDDQGTDMVVCTQAMLGRHLQRLVKSGWLSTFSVLLLDECHHTSSPTAGQALLASSAYFRLGASDTLRTESPEQHNRILGFCGPVVATLTGGQLVASGRSAKPHIYLVDEPAWARRFKQEVTAELGSRAWLYDPATREWKKMVYHGPVFKLDAKGKIATRVVRRYEDDRWVSERVPVTVAGVHLLRNESGEEVVADASYVLLDRRYDKAIISFRERNDLIVAWTKHFSVTNGWPTLVVATRSVHVIILETLLKQALGEDRVRSLVGSHTSSQKQATLYDWFRNTPGAVLISSVVKEGVSINEIKAMVIADRVVDYEVASQILGRMMRRKFDGDNHAHAIMFIERQQRNYAAKSIDLIGALETQRDCYTFYWPVKGPETIAAAQVTEPKSVVTAKAGLVQPDGQLLLV